jgi:hypothetical protein
MLFIWGKNWILEYYLDKFRLQHNKLSEDDVSEMDNK